MINKEKGISLSKLCRLLGFSRQAYHQSLKLRNQQVIQNELVILEVLNIREDHPKMGTRKLLVKIQKFMQEHRIKMGRDALFDLLSEHNLLIRNRRRSVRTTYSYHWMKKYPNLIKDFTPTMPNQLYVSDITYWRIATGFVYISFITDVFSHKIVGYHLADNMEAIETLQALKMALKPLDKGIGLIHHSDRGAQYCSGKYVNELEEYAVKISMTEDGDPRENAVAERLNGIIKLEYLECYDVANIQEAKILLDRVVKLYNEDRPHMSIGNLTPNEVHESDLKPERLWKNYYKKAQESLV